MYWVFCLTLRTEDSDRDLRCPVMCSRQSWSLSGSSVENLASQHRILVPREGCFWGSQQPIPLSRDNRAGFARWMPVASFQQDHWLRSPTLLATNAQLFPTTTFAISIGLTLSRTASVRFHFWNKLYQTDPWVSLHAYRFASRTVRGSSGSNRAAQWACGTCMEYSWTSPTLSLHIGMDVFSVLGKGKNDFQDKTYWVKKFSELSVSFNPVPNIFIGNKII